MQPSIKNIVKRSHPISQETKEKCQALNVAKYLPATVPQSMSFELHNTPPELANAIRRVMKHELDVLCLTFESIDTNDGYIHETELKPKITMIPIRQISGVEFYIDITNYTDEIIQVYSAHLRPRGNTPNNMFSKSFVIADLRPGKSIKIDKIYTIHGQSYIDGAKFTFPGPTGFKCLDDMSRSSME